MISILYAILALLGLSFLIFIHELGHYFMARRVGMRVETFSIGFGRPIAKWQRDGVQWQLGWLLFGGYVKIAGMEGDDKKDPYAVSDGFFGKSPLDRIKVSLAGPLVNIVFAILVFALLWLIGGREKNFGEFTHKIGWVDPKSELYIKGVRPGDEIVAYNGQSYQGAKDHLYAPMTAPGHIEIQGFKVQPASLEKTPFAYTVNTYPHPNAMLKDVVTAGILQPASYIIYDRLPNGQENPLLDVSPMRDSGIEYGDRLVWVDGEPIYSSQQLAHVLNDSKALVTIKRGKETLLRRVPRVQVEELRLDAAVKEELTDWQFEADMRNIKLQKLYTIPYNLNNEAIVESTIKFVDKENGEEAFPAHLFSTIEQPLEAGDQIIAVDGIPVTHSFELLLHLQQHHVNIIVERNPQPSAKPSWRGEDAAFDKEFSWEDLQKIVARIGLYPVQKSAGNLVLLEAVVPKTYGEMIAHAEAQNAAAVDQQKEVEQIEDPEKRAQVMQALASRDKQMLLGLPAIRDKAVNYNPNPFDLFGKVFEEIRHTLSALFTGSLNPKWMSGPIGIVQVVHDSSMVSLKESLYWLGAISLNLGVLNLLPLPVLDGGTICFSLFELITRKRIKPKVLETLIIPFAILLIGLFLFLTYHDLSRIFSKFFH